jgi:dienelactone hydrolase
MSAAAIMRRVLCAASIAASLPAHAENVTIPGRIIGQGMHDTLRGELYVPSGVGPFPAVVLLHGCRGVTDGNRLWAQKLASWGFVALVLDSFGSRGVSEICLESVAIPPMTRAFDAYLAMEYLRALPLVRDQKVGVMGFGHGGWSAFYLSDSWAEFAGVRPFDAIVALYPWCEADQIRRIEAPTLILTPEEDDPARTEGCRAAQEYLRTVPEWRYIEFIYYPGVWQGFDVPGLDTQVLGTGADGTRMFVLKYDQAAAQNAERRTRGWFDRFLRRKTYN